MDIQEVRCGAKGWIDLAQDRADDGHLCMR